MNRLLSIFLSLFSFAALATDMFPVTTSTVRFQVDDQQEMLDILNKTFVNKNASEIFDKIENMKFSIRLINDYNFSDTSSGTDSKGNDDIGRTHGYQVSFVKNIAPLVGEGEYFISITYDSDLYTNSTDPKAFQNDYTDMIYYSSDGIAHADQYFKEENLFKVMVGKMKSNDAYYWEAGVGFHEINADDADRGILISSLSQQTAHHEFLNSDGPSRREYNNLSQEDLSSTSGALMGEFGRDFTLSEDNNSRTFSRVGLNSRVSGITDSSFIGTYVHFGYDYNKSDTSIPAFRVTGGVNAKKYSDNSNYAETFIEARLEGKYAGASLRYVVPLTVDAAYTNALPNDFDHRADNIAPKEALIWFTIEGKIN